MTQQWSDKFNTLISLIDKLGRAQQNSHFLSISLVYEWIISHEKYNSQFDIKLA